IRLGTSFMAGPPTGSPSPALKTPPPPPPLPSPPPAPPRHETRAVRCAPSVTSGSSPASLTTTASAHEPPNSHLSTSNSTRRSAPLPGSLTSMRACGSPLASAFVAAFAAAAAQVPVVQPVLSLSPLTFSMLGGMDGSRSLRGGIVSLLCGRRPAKHVRELGAVEVGAGPTGAETGADQDQSLPRKACLPDPICEVLEAALDDFLVRPARPVDHGARGLRLVAALQELFLQGAWLRRGEEDGHGRPVPREALDVLALWHGGPARAAREDDGLRNLGHRQLATDGRRRRAQRRDARDYLPAEAHLLANLDLLHDGPVDAWISRMYTGNFQVFFHRPLVEFPHAFERYGRRFDDLRVGPGILENTFLDQTTGPDDHIRLADEPASP